MVFFGKRFGFRKSLHWRLNPYCIGWYSLGGLGNSTTTISCSLNPYCIGWYSLGPISKHQNKNQHGLNPYCIGWYSLGSYVMVFKGQDGVLILIVLDGILWAMVTLPTLLPCKVLILIVLDGILWGGYCFRTGFGHRSLNPYCIGWYSLGFRLQCPLKWKVRVS